MSRAEVDALTFEQAQLFIERGQVHRDYAMERQAQHITASVAQLL